MRKPKKELPLKDAMKAAGMSKSAQDINDFFAKHGVTGIRIGSTKLKVEPKKQKGKK